MQQLIMHLSKAEMVDAHGIATFRSSMNRNSGVPNGRRAESMTDYDVEYLGIRAEIAFGKAFKVPPSPISGNDGGVDFVIAGRTIDVKASPRSDASLVFKHRDAFKADIGVLVTGTGEATPHRMVIVGWKTREGFLDTATVTDIGGKRSLMLPQGDLSSPARLWLYLTNLGPREEPK